MRVATTTSRRVGGVASERLCGRRQRLCGADDRLQRLRAHRRLGDRLVAVARRDAGERLMRSASGGGRGERAIRLVVGNALRVNVAAGYRIGETPVRRRR